MHRNTVINWCVEFGPIVIFFLTLSIFGETSAGFVGSTALFTVTTFISLIVAYVRDRRIALFPIIAGAFVIAFGILTVIFNDPRIFIVKDTVYNGLFGIALLVGLVRGKGYLKTFFKPLFDMKDEGWKKLSFRWMIMFIILAVSNEIVWRGFSQQAWVMYKFIATVVTTAFGLYQIFLARKYRNPTASPWGLRVHFAEETVGIAQ